MNATELLASSLGIRDDVPNQKLADEIIRTERNDWVKELVDNLKNGGKDIQNDSIKALYEIGERGKAEMIAPYCAEFAAVLNSKNNRLVWGGMIALDTIASVNPAVVFKLLPVIMDATDKGSVITIDHGVGILAKLSGMPEFAGTTFPLLLEQLKRCPAKQLPMYAEKSLNTAGGDNKVLLIQLLEARMDELEKDSQKKRIEKVIKKIGSKR